MELYGRVRRACMVEGMSTREAARVYGLHRDTVRKMLKHSAPPGYRRQSPPRPPKLDPYRGVIDRILEQDAGSWQEAAAHSQAHLRPSADGVRLRGQVHDSQGLRARASPADAGDVRAADASCWPRPVRLRPGACGNRGSGAGHPLLRAGPCPQRRLLRIKAYPAETTEAFCDGHVAAFSFLGGVPRSILYDNTRLAVAKIMGDGRRRRTRVFSELVSHYLFEDRFGRPGKGNDKGKVEGLVGYARRNFLVPVPSLASFDALNAHLEERCLERLWGCDETIGERMERDLEALLPLPDTPYDASGKRLSRVSSLSLVRYRSNDYSAPAAYGHRDVIEAGDERRLLVLQKKLSRLKLIIDELGFVPLSKTGAELLFEVFSQRYERGSILLTTNLPFDKWTEALGSERLTGALLDRLTHRVHILEMNGESYRLRQSRQVTTLLSAGSPADPWLTPPTQHTSHRSRRGPHDPVLSG